MKTHWRWMLLLLGLLSACGAPAARPERGPELTAVVTNSPAPVDTLIPSPTIAPSDTATPANSATPRPTRTPTRTPRPPRPTPSAPPPAANYALLLQRQFASPAAAQSLYLYDFERRALRPLAGLELVTGPASLSPDGQWLAWLEWAAARGPFYLHQLDLASGQHVRLLLAEDFQWRLPDPAGRLPAFYPDDPLPPQEYFDTPAVRWAPDSRGLLFLVGFRLAAGYEDQAQLYYLARGSAEPVALAPEAPGGGLGLQARWSPDGRRVAFTRNASGQGLWVLEVQTGAVQRFDDLARLGPLSNPLWSPDGGRIAFAAGYNPRAGVVDRWVNNLYVLELASGEVKPLTFAKSISSEHVIDHRPLFWLAGGQSLAYALDEVRSVFDPHALSLHAAALATGRTQTLVRGGFGPELFDWPGALSPAGDRLALPAPGGLCPALAGSEAQFNQTLVLADTLSGRLLFGPGDDCLSNPAWSPDGSRLAGDVGRGVWVWDLAGRQSFAASAGPDDPPAWDRVLGWVVAPEKLAHWLGQ